MFALDEKGYSEVVIELKSIISEGSFTLQSAQSKDLIYGSQALLFPASLISYIGFEPLISLRMTSFLYSSISVVVFYVILCELHKVPSSMRFNFKKSTRLPILLPLLIFAFLPSHFLWSILGLRESGVILGLLCVVWTILVLFYVGCQTKSRNYSWWKYLVLFLGISILFMSRESIGILVIIFLIIPFLIKALVMHMVKLSVVMIFATVLGLSFSHVPSTSSNGVLNFSQRNFPTFKELLATVSPNAIAESQKMRSSNANLKIWSYLDQTSIESETAKSLQTNIRFLYDFLMVSIRPLPTERDLSTIATLAALENLFWILLYISFFIKIFSFVRSREYRLFFVSLITFFLLSSSLLIIYSGSVGSYFRHKSMFLGIILLVLSWRKKKMRTLGS
jgi:hypothetical protein